MFYQHESVNASLPSKKKKNIKIFFVGLIYSFYSRHIEINASVNGICTYCTPLNISNYFSVQTVSKFIIIIIFCAFCSRIVITCSDTSRLPFSENWIDKQFHSVVRDNYESLNVTLLPRKSLVDHPEITDKWLHCLGAFFFLFFFSILFFVSLI